MKRVIGRRIVEDPPLHECADVEIMERRILVLERENENLRAALRGTAQEACELLGSLGASGAAAMFDPDSELPRGPDRG